MILVIGATGTVGSEVAKQLVAGGAPTRVLVRDAKKLGPLAGNVEVALGDLNLPDTLVAAMRGIKRMLIVSSGTQIPVHDSAAIQAAKKAAVQHVVKLSAMGAATQPHMLLGDWHRQGERVLMDSGLAWTLVRPTSFFSNTFFWLHSIKQDHAVYLPVGDGKVCAIDPQDVAAVVVQALTQAGHAGQTYDITGPAPLSTAEQCKILGDACGQAIRFVDVPPEAAKQGMLKAKMPEVLVEAMLQIYASIKSGQSHAFTHTVEKVTGQKPGTYAAWAQRNAAAFS